MEPVESFMEILERAWRDDDKQALNRIFGYAPGYLQNVPDKYKETALSIIFDRNKGLFKIINSILDMQTSCINQYNPILEKCYHLLQFIMKFFQPQYEPYILMTKVVGLCCIKKNLALNIKIVASKTLNLLVQLFHNYDIKLYEIVKLSKEEKVLYITVGAIARYCPKHIQSLADSIYIILLIELNNQCRLTTGSQQDYIKIYLDCLLDMMVNFKPLKESSSFGYHKKLYDILLLLCEPYTNPEVVNKTILILINQMQQFSEYILKDYKKWHNLFQSLCISDPIIGEDVSKTFYKTMSILLIENYEEDIFLDFKNYFLTKLDNKNLSCRELSIIVYGLGYFSNVYVIHSPVEIDDVFQKITYRTLYLVAKKNDAENTQMLPSYLQAVIQILSHMPYFQTHHLDIILKLSVLIFEKFPGLNERNKKSAITALKLTFKNIYKLEQIYQRYYFDRLFYKRILWSCSHPLYIDIELQQDIQNLSKHPVCYKDTLQLWHELLKVQNDDEKLVQSIFKELVTVLFDFVENLCLSVKSQQNKFRQDVSLSLKANNEPHFRYFINLVDLYVDIFMKAEMNLLQIHVEKLLRYFIKCSYKHPIVSGFYKLIEAIFTKFNGIYNHKNYFHDHTCELILQYLLDVINRINVFSDELLLSCIYLVFSVPLVFIADIVDETIPVFEIAFKIGLQKNITLTINALKTLERWSSNFHYSNDFWKKIIIFMEPYFKIEPNFGNIFQDMFRNKEIKTINDREDSLETLQELIFSFYRSLDQNILLDYFNEDTLDNDSLWTKKKVLLFKLYFTDIQFEINFDKCLPRVFKLTESQNRRKKFSACEFLYTLVTFLIGKKVSNHSFKNLFYVILKLGCDMDDTIWNLYHPLVIQLTHYLSSKQMIDSKISQEFINSIFDGLIQEFSPSLRDYCGICLKEFVRWMIKQSPENDSSKSTNFSDIFNRIINFALHQENNKRLAAVTAFNYLYTILEGSISVINTYWLEFLYAFVKCLEKCNDIRVISALNNVESVIRVTQSILNSKSCNRKKHVEFPNETLKGATMWLFTQCGVLNTQCREKSMQLFENLSVLVTGYKYVKDFISSCGIGCVNAIALKNMEDFDSMNINTTKIFLRSLDFYIWIFAKRYMTPKCVLLVENDNKINNVFLNFFTKFISIINDKNIKDTVKASSSSLKEIEELNDAFNTVIFKIIDFVSIILESEENDLETILQCLWTDNLNLLISRLTLSPREIGLTSKSLQLFRPQILEKFFSLLMEKLPKVYLAQLKKKFFAEKTDNCNDFVKISEIISLKKNVDILGDFVYGMIILRNCKFYNFNEKENEFSVDFSKRIILSIFEGMKVVKMNGYANTRTEGHITIYLQDLLRFFLLEYKPELIETIVDLIVNDPSFVWSSDSISTQRENFYEPLKIPIFQCMLKNPSITLRILDSKLNDSPKKLFTLIENLLYFAQRNHTKQSDELANEVIKKCDDYRALLGQDMSQRNRFFNFNTIAVELNPMGVMPIDGVPRGLYAWILEEFSKAKDLECIAVIIESFLICMTDETNKPNEHLSMILWNLRCSNTEIWLQVLKKNEITKSQAVQCLRSLLKMLLVTKSWIVFEGLIKYVAGVCKFFANESIAEYVKSYFTSILAGSISQVLDNIYRIFQGKSTFNANERLDILEYFLLPSLEACRVSVIGRFYEQCRAELARILNKELHESDLIERRQSLVSKIGSFRIFELMFGRLTSPAKDAIDLLLLDRNFEIRSYSTPFPEEKEILRLLNCAALNCSIAVVGSKGNNERYALIFRELHENNIFLWERIIDCEKKYNFHPGPLELKIRSINIRRTNEDLQTPTEPTFDFYFSRYDPTDIDFNKCNNPTDRRQFLSLEEDEFNNHECTAMITGFLIHLSKSVRQLTEGGREISEADLPVWLICFRGAFSTNKDNIRLLLMRIISNARGIFIPYLKLFFYDFAKTVINYLQENPLNYLVRNILFLFIDCKYELKNDSEVATAQELFEVLIDKLKDTNVKVCHYNMQILQNFAEIWNEHLKVPMNLEIVIQRDEELAIKIVLMLFRHGVDRDSLIKKREVHKLVRKLMFRWQEPTTPQTYETLGWIMRFITEEQRDLLKKDLVELLVDMQRFNKDICVRNFYLTFIGCPILSRCEELRRFRDPIPLENDERRAECFEIFIESMTDLSAEEIALMLDSMNLVGLLRDRVLPCVNIGFRILCRLVIIFEETQLLPYAKVMEVYTKKDSLLEHKKMAYMFFIRLYTKIVNKEDCMTDQIDEPSLSTLLNLSRKILINGTIDPSDEIQDELLTFWKERLANFTNTQQRLYHLLKLYTLEIHSSFAQFFCIMILDLTTQSPVDNRILFAPLVECWFEDHEITTSNRRDRIKKKIVRSAPLFAPSLAGMLERAVVEQGSRMRRLDRDERLQETPAGSGAMSLDVIDRLTKPNDPIRLERTPDPSRIPTSSQKSQSSTLPRCYINEYYEKIRQEKLEQNDSVKVNRRYRIGSYPDVEISQSDIVVTLDDLVRQDAKFANDLAVLIINSMAKSIEDTVLHSEFMNAIAEFCRNVLKEPNDFAPTAMEILLKTRCINFNVNDVTKIAKKMGHQSLGILLLEMVTIEHNKSKYFYQTQSMFANAIVQPLHHHLELSNLYRSIDQLDVVASIFRNWIFIIGLDHLRQGGLAEIEGDWQTAKTEYEMGWEIQCGADKDYCVDGLLRCLSELSSWTEINKNVDAILKNNYDLVWQNPRKDDLLPWILKGQLQKRLEDITSGRSSEYNFIDLFLDSWLNSYGTSITKLYGDELCMFYICSEKESSETTAHYCLKNCLEFTREQWIQSSRIVEVPRKRILMNLRKINELDLYLRVLKSQDPVEAIKELMNYWYKSPINEDYNLLSANQLFTFRLAFTNILIERFKEVYADSGILIDVLSASLNENLKISELAITNRNKTLARKHIMRIERTLDQYDVTNVHYATLRSNFNLTASRYKFFCGEIETVPQNKFIYYTDAWQLADTILQTANADSSTRIQAKRHTFDITLKVLSTIMNNENCVQLVTEQEFTKKILDLDNVERIREKLLSYAWKTLQSACQEGSDKEIAESYMKFAEYCCGLVEETNGQETYLCEKLISTVLTAMSLGSTKAARYFPYLLRYSLFTNNVQASNLFIEKCINVPTWMFLSWQDQITSCLLTSLSTIILPIVERLAKEYPNAIIYSFRGTCQDQPNLRNNLVINNIYKTLFSDTKIETFFKAMEYLCQPELYLRHGLLLLIPLITDRKKFIQAINDLVKKASEYSDQDIYFKGPVYKEVYEKYHNNIQKLKIVTDEVSVERQIKKICDDLNRSMMARLKIQKSIKSSQLANYSPYLSDFICENLGMEIPGQYVGYQKPLPALHIKIVRIEGVVEVIDVSGYLKISLLGTNSQSYEFLVKIGTDMRRDQRMQRFFELVNENLSVHIKCKIRKLSISTYKVVPLSKSLGLVQWINESKSLKEFVSFSTLNRSDVYTGAMKYQNWIEQAANDELCSINEIHRRVLLEYSAKEVISKMKELTSTFSWDLLRKTFVRLSLSIESFFKLRHNFIQSYATMCAIHWVAGVGDRRLENTLIERTTGKCFSLDFRLVFDTAIHQPFPELVSLRLTNQILGLLRPFGEKDLFCAIMSQVLSAMREEKNVILACLHAFLNEPLDWDETLVEMWKANNNGNSPTRVTWLPKKTIRIIKKKLNGAKPSNIILDELSCMHDDNDTNVNKYFATYKRIVNGSEFHHFRSRSFLNHAILTPEEQVMCLLDQATDMNVLGRMPPKWIPFI